MLTPGRPVSLERRLLILGPTRRDVELTQRLLADADIECRACSDMDEVCGEAERGVGAMLLAEEAVHSGADALLMQWLAAQPAWSDLPILLLTTQGADSNTAHRLFSTLGNVALVERPTHLGPLASAVLSALRAREKQYQIRDYVRSRERLGDALLESDRRKDEFLATLAHELRNPLAPIMNAAQLLGVAPTPATIAWAREVLDRQVRLLTRLVDDLLDIARITRGKVELRKQRIDLASVVHSSVETSRSLIVAGRHQLELVMPEEPIEIDADPVRLSQVFGNLLNNAAKYTSAGGRIRLEVTRAGAEVVVSVRDTGIGIPPHMLPHVFDMFTQGEDALERTQGGLGIGLTLVRRFVEMHGGSVTALSAGRNGGSEFVVRLPVANAPAALAAADDDSQPGAAAAISSRILIVEDNRDGAESLRQLLVLAGHDVRIASDGLQGVQLVDELHPDIVLMDIGLPGINGYEAARRIRQTEQGRKLTLIAMTGWGQPEDRRRARLAGFDYHFVKPIDLSSLQMTLYAIQASGGRSAAPEYEHSSSATERAD